MAKLESFLSVLGHYKYLLTIIIGLLVVIIFSDNSAIHLMQLSMQKSDLENEIKDYNRQHDEADKELKEIKNTPNAVEKVARERYFMKKDDEDIFVLSSDISEQEKNEQEETLPTDKNKVNGK